MSMFVRMLLPQYPHLLYFNFVIRVSVNMCNGLMLSVYYSVAVSSVSHSQAICSYICRTTSHCMMESRTHVIYDQFCGN